MGKGNNPSSPDFFHLRLLFQALIQIFTPEARRQAVGDRMWWWFSYSVLSNSCDPIDCSLPGSSVLGIPQARILEWVAISFSKGSSQPKDQTRRSPGERTATQPVHPKGHQSWVFIGRNDAEAETPSTSCEELTHWKRP